MLRLVIGRLLASVAALGLRWPRPVLVTIAAVTLVCGLLLRDFRIEPDISRMLPESREVALFHELERRTGGGRSLLIVVHGDDLVAVEASVRGLASRLRASPLLERVHATRSEWFGNAPDQVAPLWLLPAPAREALRARLTTERRAALADMLANLASDPLAGQEIAVADPLGLREILAPAASAAAPLPLAPGSEYMVLEGGRVGALLAIGAREPYDIDFSRALLADVENRLAPASCELWGGYVVAREQSTRMQESMVWATSCAGLLVGLYLAVALRAVLLPLLVLLPTGIAIVWALPLGAALCGPFNVIAVGAAAVLLGLGDDFSMHYFARYGAERARAAAGPNPHAEATARTVATIGTPIVLGGLTTCAAFLSLALGEFQGLAGFGVLLSLGVILAILLTFALAPAVLASPWLQRVLRVPPPRSPIAAALERLACSRAGMPVALALALAGLAGLALAAACGLRFDVSADAMSPRASAADAQRVRVETLVGFSPVPVTVLLDPAIPPERLRAGVEALRAQGGIAFVDGPMPALPDAATRADVAAFRVATADWVAGALADLQELECDAGAFAPGLRRQAEILARDPPAVAERYLLSGADGARLALFCYPTRGVRSEASWGAFTAVASGAFGPACEPFGAYSLLAQVRRVLLHDLRICTFATGVLVVLLALALTRGHWLGWLAVVPVLVGTGITVGLLVLCDVPLNLANFVAVPFVLGIGADDGLHLASHYRDGDRRAGPGPVGVAICRTTITTALGFGSLLATSNPGLQSFGLIACAGVVANLLTSLLVMVPLVRWLAFRRPAPAGSAAR